MLGRRPTVISERARHTWVATPANLGLKIFGSSLKIFGSKQQGGGA